MTILFKEIVVRTPAFQLFGLIVATNREILSRLHSAKHVRYLPCIDYIASHIASSLAPTYRRDRKDRHLVKIQSGLSWCICVGLACIITNMGLTSANADTCGMTFCNKGASDGSGGCISHETGTSLDPATGKPLY